MSKPSEQREEEASGGSTVDSFLREVARAPQVAAFPVPGDLIAGKYRIERLLGTGAMGAVFVARHELLQQSVALKVMLPEIATSHSAADRFLNEARAAARIEGEHVARVLDVGHSENGAPFIAMELLDGVDLAQALSERGRFSQRDALHYLLQALEAVAQAHALGIVHRDLKPANLFLARRRDGTQLIKVLDFGISKVQNAQTATSPNVLTQSSAMLGSPLYMSPEQVRNSSSVDARADIWAFGVILFEMLAGVPPFDARTVHHVLVQIIEDKPLPLRNFCPDLPPDLEAIVMRCLAKDRQQRFSQVAELAQALAPFAGAESRQSLDRIRRLTLERPLSRPPESDLELAATEFGSNSVPARLNAASTADRAHSKRWLVIGACAVGLVGLGLGLLFAAKHAASPVPLPVASARSFGVPEASAQDIALHKPAPSASTEYSAPSASAASAPPTASIAPRAPEKRPPRPRPRADDPFDTPR